MSLIVDVKANILSSKIYELLSPSVYNPTPERLLNRAKKYQTNAKIKVYAYNEKKEYSGIIAFEIDCKAATILDIAVKTEHQDKGIGSRLIDFIFNQFEIDKIIAETDDDAIGFYEKYGFVVTDVKSEFNFKRYACECSRISYYYDYLIDDNNDPVQDSKPLKDYMDKWDGQAFIDKLELDPSKNVLEIGVGTGRLAVRTAPYCNEFYGIDISPKTVGRAKENLRHHKNVKLICADFLSYSFDKSFEVIYSSLTFMHIKEKQKAINKAAALLNKGGRFVLSIDKNTDQYINYGGLKIKIFPDNATETEKILKSSGLEIKEIFETEFVTVFIAQK